MSHKPKILMVDDEPNILSGYRRSIGKSFQVITAEGGAAGLAKMDEEGPFPVIITDMRMPEMDGVAFLLAAKKKHPDSVFAMLTGNADQQTAIDAINKGQIFRFLNKPCPGDVLEQTVHACLRQHELIQAEKVLLKETLAGCIRVLSETVALSDPEIGRISRAVRANVQMICEGLGIPADWRLTLGASLCLLGRTVTQGVGSGSMMSDESLKLYSESGSNLLKHIPRLEDVAEMISKQRDTGQLPDSLEAGSRDERVLIGAHILRFAIDFQREYEETGGNYPAARERLRAYSSPHDKRFIDAAERHYAGESGRAPAKVEYVSKMVSVRDLRAEMIIDQDVVTGDKTMLLSKGHALSTVLIERLKGFARAGLIGAEVAVLVEIRPEQDAQKAA